MNNYLSLFILIALLPFYAMGSPSALNFQARIAKSDGSNLEAPSVSFRFRYLNETETCTVYVEDFNNVSMVGSGGNVSFTLGAGAKFFPPTATQLSSTFNNSSTNIMACAEGGNYTPTLVSEKRSLRVEFVYTGSGGIQTLNGIEINSVPYAWYASDTDKLGGFAANLYAKFSDITSCTGGNLLQFNGSTFSCIAPSGTFSGVLAGDVSGTQSATVVDTVGGKTSAQVSTSVDDTLNATSSATASRIVKRDASGNASFNEALANNFSGRNLLLFEPTDTNKVTIQAPATFAAGDYTLILPDSNGAPGQVLSTDGAGLLSWIPAATGGGTVTNIATGTGLTGGPITTTGTISLANTAVTPGTYGSASAVPSFTVDAQGRLTSAGSNAYQDATGVTKGIVSVGANLQVAGGVISLQNADTTNTGALTSADWNTFNSKQAAGNYITALTGDITAAGPGSAAATIANLAVTNAKINDVAFTKITGLPTTLSGYGITDSVRNAGVGAGNIVSSIQSGNTAGRPAFGTDGRIYMDTQAGIIYRDSGAAWVTVATTGTAGAVTGTGTINQLSKFTAAGTIGDSNITDNGTTVSISTDATVNGVRVGVGAGSISTNTALGAATLNANTTGNNNLAVGASALTLNTSGSFNIAVGTESMAANTTGNSNTAVGRGSLYTNTSGSANAGFGTNALRLNTVGTSNTSTGFNSLFNNTTGSRNVANGYFALVANETGSDNTAIGFGALSTNIVGSINTAVGYNALSTTTGSSNTALGNNAGTAITTGSSNVVIGSNSGSTIATSSNNIIISDGSGTIRQQIDSSGRVGIGMAPATYMLNVNGDINIPSGSNFKINGMNLANGGGTVINVATGTGLTGGPITASGTISLANTAVTPGTYGSASAVPSFTVDAQGRLTGVVSNAYQDATGVTKGIVSVGTNLQVAGGVISLQNASTTNTGALTSADWNTFNNKQAAGNYITALTGDITATGPGSAAATIANNAVTTAKINNLAVTDAKIFDVAFTKITGLPTTLSGYGITDSVRNAGVGAGNVVTSMQSGNTAGRPAFGTDGRIYMDTQAGIIYRDSGAAWVAVASTGAGGTVTNVTSANTDIGVATGTSTPVLTLNSGVGANQILKLNGTSQIPAVDGSLLTNLDAGQIVTGVLPIARGGTNATTANGALNNLLPTQAANAGRVLQTDGTNTSWVVPSLGTVTSVTAGAPLLSSGGATPNITMPAATGAVDGYLTAADFTIFNNKQAAGNYITALTGDITATGPGSAAATIANNAVTTAKINNLAVTDAKIFDVAFTKITGLPTTLSGYGITDSVRNAGVGAGNVVTSMQSGNTVGRPAFGTDGRIYIDTQAGIIYRDSGAAWVAVASTTGSGGTVTGTGTINQLSKFTAAGAIGDSNISDDGTLVSISTDANINGLTVGHGFGNVTTNAVLGESGLRVNVTGNHNLASGYRTLYSNTSGSNNTASGGLALFSNTTGPNNTATGVSALYSNTTGNHNSAFGVGALNFNSTGLRNVASGSLSLYENTIGSYNTGLGYYSLKENTTGNNNTAIGYNSGSAITTGSNNVVIGSNTGSSIATSSNNIIISDGAGTIRQQIDSSGLVGIGMAPSTYALSVNGDINIPSGSNFKINGVNIGAGSVTSVAATLPLTSTGGATPTIAMPAAATAQNGYLTSADWNTFNSKLGTASAFAGDVTGTSGATVVERIRGTNVSITAIASGNFLKYDGTNWVNSTPAISDITNLTTQLSNKIDSSQMPGTCTSAQTLSFISPTGSWSCTAIAALDASTITTGTIASARLPASATVWAAATGGIEYTGGNVGVATTGTPQSTLDVNGVVGARAINEGVVSYVNSTATYTIPDTTSSVRQITLTANATITLPAFSSPTGKVFTLTVFIRQDATGSRTLTWAGNGADTIKWDSGVAPTISAVANRITILQFTKPAHETVWYASEIWQED